MLKAINLIGFYVNDPVASVGFYQQLGFETVSPSGDTTEVRLGTCRLTFTDKKTAGDKPAAFQKDAFGEPKGTGLYINIEVTDIDEFFNSLESKGIKTSSQPHDWPWGQREFVLRDPDGYKLVFYQPI